MEPASKRLKAHTGASVELPPYVMWEVLLRVPARALCRGRVVCRSWHSLLSDPSFITTYASRRPGLILALAADGDHVDMVDLSGNVVQRIDIPAEDFGAPHASPGPLYLFRANHHGAVRVIDPETRAFSTLPTDHLDKPAVYHDFDGACYTLGLAAFAGDRKVLRVATRHDYKYLHGRVEQDCHVFTLGDDRYHHGRRWRPRLSPPVCLRLCFGTYDVVIHGVVYFLADQHNQSFDLHPPNGAESDANRVASFDLETEEWRPTTLPGPPSIDAGAEDCLMRLATLNGKLVIAHCDDDHPTVGLWFAEDVDKGLWVKQYSVTPQESMVYYPSDFVDENLKLLKMLEDGRVVYSFPVESTWKGPDYWRTMVFDPQTNESEDVPHLGACSVLGIYVEENRLCLESG